MKIGIIIQARMGSERLPGKVLKTINGRSILEILLERIKACGMPVVVATTLNKADDILIQKLKSLNVAFFRGSEEDVLSRYYECAKENKFDCVIRLTADNPFVNADLIMEVTSAFLKEKNENLYMSTKKYPLGIALEIFSIRSLREAFFNAKDIKEREHVTPYIINNKKVVKKFISYRSDKEHYRLTIDTENDFILAKELITKYGAENLGVDEIVAILDAHPELGQLNSAVHQKKWNE